MIKKTVLDLKQLIWFILTKKLYKLNFIVTVNFTICFTKLLILFY